jgi:hypothetical protein
MLSDGSQVGHVFSVLPLVGCKPAYCSAMNRKWSMFFLTVVVCLPDKLWFSQVGYVCIASGGLLTSQLRTAGKEHVCIVSGGLLTSQLRTAGKEHVRIASEGVA